MNEHLSPPPDDGETRRGLLSRFSSIAMAGGLAAGYGMFTHICGRYLYPAKDPERRWVYVTRVADLAPGAALVFKTPAGASISVARSGPGVSVTDFVALSSVCPHLGCQVHWQAQQNQFFCPCHNGAFDKNGVATAGPPKEAGQALSRYPLEIKNGLLFIQIPAELSASAEEGTVEAPGGPTGPGHDPCLHQRPREV